MEVKDGEGIVGRGPGLKDIGSAENDEGLQVTIVTDALGSRCFPS